MVVTQYSTEGGADGWTCPSRDKWLLSVGNQAGATAAMGQPWQDFFSCFHGLARTGAVYSASIPAGSRLPLQPSWPLGPFPEGWLLAGPHLASAHITGSRATARSHVGSGSFSWSAVLIHTGPDGSSLFQTTPPQSLYRAHHGSPELHVALLLLWFWWLRGSSGTLMVGERIWFSFTGTSCGHGLQHSGSGAPTPGGPEFQCAWC